MTLFCSTWIPRKPWAWLALLTAVVTAGWWVASDSRADRFEPAALSVSENGTPSRRSTVGASIVVTLRWGVTDHRTGQSEMVDPEGVNWDGFLALDCGSIERVEPLAFEMQNPRSAYSPHSDFMGDVVEGVAGDQRVYWRSRTDAGWDGVRVTVRACDPDVSVAQEAHAISTLVVRTAQRDYTARLDWSANDFVALATERRGQKLEVYINAEHNVRSLRGARITRATQSAAAESVKTER